MEKTVTNKIKRSFIGQVVKAAMQKTVVVEISTMKSHPKYNKYFRVSKRYHVHDEKGEAKVGDKVKFVESRPLSKTKRWYLTEILK